jgi:hypothetical protein|tara:strand:+ start:841 stop:1074 length:234 start_codon:yes stop_codon:yes gene_type:complete
MNLVLKKGDLVKFWLNKHCGVVTGILTDLYDRDRSMFERACCSPKEKWATIEVLTDRIGIWPVEIHKLKKIGEVQSA